MKKLLAVLIVFLIIPISASASRRVVGSISVLESKKSIVLTRDNHSPKVYTGGIPQSDFDDAFNNNKDLIAYVIYPDGPTCLISDYSIDGTASCEAILSGDVFDILTGTRDYYLSIGCDTCVASIESRNDIFFVSFLSTVDSSAYRSNLVYYVKNNSMRAVAFDFIGYDDIIIWNNYTLDFMDKVQFNVDLIDLNSEVDI